MQNCILSHFDSGNVENNNHVCDYVCVTQLLVCYSTILALAIILSRLVMTSRPVTYCPCMLATICNTITGKGHSIDNDDGAHCVHGLFVS